MDGIRHLKLRRCLAGKVSPRRRRKGQEASPDRYRSERDHRIQVGTEKNAFTLR